ncbi:deazaflavin-dependent oxidoreductase, nitroreductase family [Pedococcus dokdonensis]|uniref:Deazaflavin-dependent oxidoreductase, nitroreductase family n=1 Tax=Pedococcus dokdonensis TaxID=443156 RepID=A0A1H0T2M7_9MICO|nr:nitroreductase/quinone reductase family protein [Pedococcus dokdonensis]SDP48239.1 deazaflavin-dependent oxidoreductase, nitroreductase family [Pedococcus dokdonensis]
MSTASWGNRIGVWMYRRLDGRAMGGTAQAPVVMLTTTGRRTGLPRSTCVRALRQPDGFLVWGTGSGSPHDPDWFRNLRAAGETELRVPGHGGRALARELVGAERDRVWDEVVLAALPGVARYARKAGRPIPVALLTPVGQDEKVRPVSRS